MKKAPQKMHDLLDLLVSQLEYNGTGVIEHRWIINCGGIRRHEMEFKRAVDGVAIIIGNPCAGCQK